MAIILLSHARQVADHLRSEIMAGRWREVMPGGAKLGAELGVNHTTMGAALRMLEKEGLLVARGGGRCREIVLPEGTASSGLRVGLFLYEPSENSQYVAIEVRHQLMQAGHVVNTASKSLRELGMDLKRISRVVQRTEADAWVVMSGPKEVLSWFADQPVPVLAYIGTLPENSPIAAVVPAKRKSFEVLMHRLISLGHSRIIFLSRSGARPLAFIQSLEAHGISVGPYNTPDVRGGPEELRARLGSLFATTPPTALIIGEAYLFIAAQQYLARKGIFAPEHVSLVCSDPDPLFEWCEPSIAHISWEMDPLVRRIVRWVDQVSQGKDDRRLNLFRSQFVDGGTIGPARVRK